MGEVKKQDFFCLDNFKALNGEGYRPEDIRTYAVPPLASSPARDIEIHLGLPQSSGQRGGSLIRTHRGNFSGYSSVQITEKAQKLILHFPKASDIKTPKGLVQIDRKKLPSLHPTWLISRYGRENLGPHLNHEVPLFLDKGSKQFLYFFDESFLDEIDPAALTKGIDKCHFKVYQDSDRRRYLALRSDDFKDINALANSRLHCDNPLLEAWVTLADNYKQLTLDAKDLEKVIVVKASRNHSTDLNKNSIAEVTRGTAHLSNASMQMTFGLAARHRNNYYWMDANGEINTQVTGHVVRGHTGSALGLLRGGGSRPEPNDITVVIPYSDDDWEKLVLIKARLDAIESTLWELISGCQGDKDSQIDNNLSDSARRLDSNNLLGIGVDK